MATDMDTLDLLLYDITYFSHCIGCLVFWFGFLPCHIRQGKNEGRAKSFRFFCDAVTMRATGPAGADKQWLARRNWNAPDKKPWLKGLSMAGCIMGSPSLYRSEA
jgi:hypothetical protein